MLFCNMTELHASVPNFPRLKCKDRFMIFFSDRFLVWVMNQKMSKFHGKIHCIFIHFLQNSM